MTGREDGSKLDAYVVDLANSGIGIRVVAVCGKHIMYAVQCNLAYEYTLTILRWKPARI